MNIRSEIKDIEKNIIDWRRDFHQYPELGFDEHRTSKIIGEALNQLSKVDPVLASKISDLPQIIAFRNQLIHGYAKIKATTVWTVIEDSLPPLLKCVSELLDDLGEA